MRYQDITEGKVHDFTLRWGGDSEAIRLIENPTAPQVKYLLDQSSANGRRPYLRGISYENTKILLWDGFKATHDDVMHEIFPKGENHHSEYTYFEVSMKYVDVLKQGDYDLNQSKTYANIVRAQQEFSKHALSEQVFAKIPSPYTVEKRVIYKNPSASEFRSLLNNLKPDRDPETEQSIPGTIRALLVPETQDILIWDGFFAPHGYVKDRFHFDDALHLILTQDTVRVLTLWRYERKGLQEAIFGFHGLKNVMHMNLKKLAAEAATGERMAVYYLRDAKGIWGDVDLAIDMLGRI